MAVGAIGGRDKNSLTRYLEALAQPRRRYTLYYLYERNGGNIADLSTYILSCEQNGNETESDEKERNSIRTELHHNHLQQLEEAGLISYDERTGDVSLEDLPLPFLVLLGVCQSFENPQ